MAIALRRRSAPLASQPLRGDSGPLEPCIDLGRVEAQEVAPLQERDAALGDEPADMTPSRSATAGRSMSAGWVRVVSKLRVAMLCSSGVRG